MSPKNRKNVKGFLLPSSDPLNFQYSRRLGKDSKSTGNRQKPGHPKSSWRSLTSPGFQPDLPWSSTTSCCCRALALTPREQSESLESLESCKPECWHMELLRLQTKGSEESEGLPWADQGCSPGPADTGRFALAPATTQGVCLQLGPGLWALPLPSCWEGSKSHKRSWICSSLRTKACSVSRPGSLG